MQPTRQKKKTVFMAGLMLLGIGLFGVRPAQAANPDVMVISVTPNVTYGVAITSVNAQGYQFGTVALGDTVVSTAAIVVTNSGAISEYFSMAITDTSGNWNVVAGAPTQDEYRMMALLQSGAPVSGDFSDALANPPVPGAAANLYGQGTTKTLPAASQNLWLRLDMPASLNTGTAGAQTMTLTVNGQAS